MATREQKAYLPSLLDRISDARAQQRAREAAHRRVREARAALDAASPSAGDRAALMARYRDALAGLERTEQLTRTWDDIRECVRRDLEWLFNAHAYAPAEALDAFPRCRGSVLNYGIPDLTGTSASGLDVRALERRIHEAIRTYEPRILSRSLRVRLDAEASDMDHNSLVLEIEGLLWAEPTPIHLRLKTKLDLEEDLARVIEFQA